VRSRLAKPADPFLRIDDLDKAPVPLTLTVQDAED